MAGSYSAQERRRLADALARGEAPTCPACGAALARREIAPKRDVPYVRRRVWLICPACKRSAAVDAARRG